MIMFLAAMPAYAIAVASTHCCPSSPVMFVWSPCGTQPDGSCAFLQSCVFPDCTYSGLRCSHLGAWQGVHWHCCCRQCEIQPLSQPWKWNRAESHSVCAGVNRVCEMTIPRLLLAAHLSFLTADDNLCNCSLCPFCQE